MLLSRNLNKYKSKMKGIYKCEACGSGNLLKVMDLGCHPLCDDLIPIDSPKKNEEFPIVVHLCQDCLTAHQEIQIPKTKLFPLSYHYRAKFTKDVQIGMKDLVANTMRYYGELKGKTVVDIGCNDGSLLNFFKEEGAITIGIEPTDAIKDANEKHHLYQGYFDDKMAKKVLKEHGIPDFICFTNVFAHISNLKTLISNVNSLTSLKTKIIIENHYLGSVLETSQFDTFYHEHPRTYSLSSFVVIAKLLSKEIQLCQFPKRYGGNIRVFFGSESIDTESSIRNYISDICSKEKNFKYKFDSLNKFIEDWKSKKFLEIKELSDKYGPLPAKAFPGRAAILIKLLNLNEKHIKAVFEKPGSPKIGHYVPGTRIPIYDEKELIKFIDKTPIILNLAWHISDEIREYLNSAGFRGELINII